MDRRVKIHRIISIVVLGLCVYGLLLPLISPVLSKWLPELWTCPFLKITGQECPFCGITRGFTDIYTLDTSRASTISLVALMVLLFEVVFRTMVIFAASALREKSHRRLMVFDVTIHTLMTVLLAIYVIMFLVNNF